MTTDPVASPRYSIRLKRNDPKLNLNCAIVQCDGPEALARAHRAVMWLADQDQDEAQLANGLGFSKSDTKAGRNLANISTLQVILSSILTVMAVNLARKYRRQLPHEYLVDQQKQQNLKIQ
ncbi:hypothetical protein [Rhizobium sp. Root482]|uniref:hypothetical protein n=1 Tax=Rhizobium sp. Root482 TaxID=1736543 RepID=UPI0006F7CAB1|nr:hypothetical protein [Rhizobium sp. Root482]KQY20064.1 hypothetical protein ASD31_06735 [Rhizobium sp. Root482]